jgi:hypothetical protein
MIDVLARDQPQVAGAFRASERDQVNGRDRVTGTHRLIARYDWLYGRKPT